MKMGEYIKQLRLQRGWSQDELGKKVNVNRAAVNKWETGVVENIKRSTIRDLAKVFDVSPSDLMCWDDDSNLSKVQSEVEICELLEQNYGKEAIELLDLFLQLDPGDRSTIKDFIIVLLNKEKYQT